MKYLLDTCAISEPLRKTPEPKVVEWIAERDESSLYLSVITVGELHKGVAKLDDGKRKNAMRNWLDEDLAKRFQGRILPVDSEVAAEWGRIQGEALAKAQPLPVIDSMISATAVVHNLTVVTRNTKDFRRCGVNVFDPWI